jgi:hypothetical protein
MLRTVTLVATRFLQTACVLTGVVLLQSAIGSSASAFPNVPVPEIDPGSISSAMTLLVGAALYIMGRRATK